MNIYIVTHSPECCYNEHSNSHCTEGSSARGSAQKHDQAHAHKHPMIIQ